MPKQCLEIQMKLQGKIKEVECIDGFNWISWTRPPAKLSELRKIARQIGRYQ